MAKRRIFYLKRFEPLSRISLWLFGIDIITDASGSQGGTWTHKFPLLRRLPMPFGYLTISHLGGYKNSTSSIQIEPPSRSITSLLHCFALLSFILSKETAQKETGNQKEYDLYWSLVVKDRVLFMRTLQPHWWGWRDSNSHVQDAGF